MSDSFKHYTELPYVLQALQTKELTLVSPKGWDDKNDAFSLEQYRKRRRLRTVLAMCLTQAWQTYHHWRVFTHGASGSCIYFKTAPFVELLSAQRGVIGKPVRYRSFKELRKKPPTLAELPFLKRIEYEPELEFRVIYESSRDSVRSYTIPFDINLVERVVVNPWLPTSTVASLGDTIRGIPGCQDLAVNRATIVESDEWRSFSIAAVA